MRRSLSVLVLSSSMLLGAAFAAAPPRKVPSLEPITTDRGEIGKLLLAWQKDGTAAGNVGDWYDNRDGEHSPLDLRPWPQLSKVAYTQEDRQRRRDWAFMPFTRKHATFGNSSTSGPPERNGSNPRSAYCSPRGLEIIESQYLGNNLYIYPEHRDHDMRIPPIRVQ